MSLSCSCDFEPEPGTKCWFTGEDFSKMPQLIRRKRCCSCNSLIESGSDVVSIPRYKVPETDIEIRIYGEDGEIPLTPWYLCERCGEIYLTLVEVGYGCIYPPDTLDAQAEYWEMTGFDPNKYKTAPAPVEGLATCP